MNTMTLGTSTFLVAVGAIMRYAVSARADGWSVPMVGAILMIVGVVGAVLSLVLWAGSSRRTTGFVDAPRAVIVEKHEVR
jgi:hypothetical protein